jgi:Flp pilus assembly protein TadB
VKSAEEHSGRVEDRLGTCDDVRVPLSEEEQRILRQIEQQLEQDPTFSQRGYRVSRRRSLLLTFGLVLGLVITIGGLAVNFVVAFAGFVLVLVMAIMLEQELRLLGRERLGQLPISAWLSGRRPDVDDDVNH